MKKRTNITINPSLYEKALAMMEQSHFDDFSGFLEHLIRQEYDRRTPEQKALLKNLIERTRVEDESDRTREHLEKEHILNEKEKVIYPKAEKPAREPRKRLPKLTQEEQQ